MNPVEMTQAINHALLETTIASTFALLLVLLTRRRLRVAFGATVAYAAWLLVPVASIAVLLPAASAETVSIPFVYRFVAQPMQAAVAVAEPSIHLATRLCSAWLLGVIAMLLYFIRQQHQFKVSLGRLLVRGADVLQADAVAGLPAAIGLMNPVIVLPADFDTRYSAEQQELMLVHERTHIRHGDLHANAAFLALRCLFWFNPLLHLVARAFRHDQELVCDQRVIARHPTSRRAYGEAMFRTQLATQALPLGCHWGFTHPLKERIEMLKQPAPTLKRMLAGAALVSALVSGGAYAAWASQPAHADIVKAAPLDVDTQPVQVAAATPPKYPQVALEQGISGTVMLIVDVAADGSVGKIVIERSEPEGTFDAAAIEAARNWRFNPAMEQGKPVASRIRVPIEFDAKSGSTDGKAGAESDYYVNPAPAKLTMAPPAYPKDEADKKIEGSVVLIVDVAADGTVTKVELERGSNNSNLDREAATAAAKWKFTPKIKDGKAVASRVRVPVDFRMDDPDAKKS